MTFQFVYFDVRISGASIQSHYIEVAQGAIFMEQNMRFELILDWLVICTGKKVFGRLLATFEGSFLCFRGQKIYIFF